MINGQNLEYYFFYLLAVNLLKFASFISDFVKKKWSYLFIKMTVKS